MRTRLTRLDFVALAAVACYVAVALPFLPSVLWYVAGTVLCFLLTGLALSDALLPPQSGGLVRFTAVIASTLAVLAVGGFILNVLPHGVSQANWISYGLVTTLLAYAFARVRSTSESPRRRKHAFPIRGKTSWAKVATSVLMLTAAVVISVMSKSWTEKPFTELWLIPDTADRSPSHATHALLGVTSHESSTQKFTVVLDTGKSTMETQISLAPDQKWTRIVPLEGPRAVASIFRADADDKPYRTVFLGTD